MNEGESGGRAPPHTNGELSAQAHAPLPAAGAQRKDARRATKPKSEGELAPDPSQCRAGEQPVRNSRFRRARTWTAADARSAHRGNAPMRLREFSRATLNCHARSKSARLKACRGPLAEEVWSKAGPAGRLGSLRDNCSVEPWRDQGWRRKAGQGSVLGSIPATHTGRPDTGTSRAKRPLAESVLPFSTAGLLWLLQ